MPQHQPLLLSPPPSVVTAKTENNYPNSVCSVKHLTIYKWNFGKDFYLQNLQIICLRKEMSNAQTEQNMTMNTKKKVEAHVLQVPSLTAIRVTTQSSREENSSSLSSISNTVRIFDSSLACARPSFKSTSSPSIWLNNKSFSTASASVSGNRTAARTHVSASALAKEPRAFEMLRPGVRLKISSVWMVFVFIRLRVESTAAFLAATCRWKPPATVLGEIRAPRTAPVITFWRSAAVLVTLENRPTRKQKPSCTLKDETDVIFGPAAPDQGRRLVDREGSSWQLQYQRDKKKPKRLTQVWRDKRTTAAAFWMGLGLWEAGCSDLSWNLPLPLPTCRPTFRRSLGCRHFGIGKGFPLFVPFFLRMRTKRIRILAGNFKLSKKGAQNRRLWSAALV